MNQDATNTNLIDPSTTTYFDGNALTKLWDWHTSINKEGATGDPLDESPFSESILSIYTLDEFITIPLGNALTKHVVFLTIYPSIGVAKSPDEISFTETEEWRISKFLLPSDHVSKIAKTRVLALAGVPRAKAALQNDIDNKQKRIDADIKQNKTLPISYVAQEKRKSLSDVIKLITTKHKLEPAKSYEDYKTLCKRLYEEEVRRSIDRPSKDRKGAKWRLNQQIDFYHLMYLPLVKKFVTDDKYLFDIAKEIVRQFNYNTEVENVAEFKSKWIKSRLTQDT